MDYGSIEAQEPELEPAGNTSTGRRVLRRVVVAAALCGLAAFVACTGSTPVNRPSPDMIDFHTDDNDMKCIDQCSSKDFTSTSSCESHFQIGWIGGCSAFTSDHKVGAPCHKCHFDGMFCSEKSSCWEGDKDGQCDCSEPLG